MSEGSCTQWSTIALDETKLRKTSIVLRWRLKSSCRCVIPASLVAACWHVWCLTEPRCTIPQVMCEAVCRLRFSRRLPSSASSAKSRGAKCPRLSGGFCCQPEENLNTKQSHSVSQLCCMFPNRLSINLSDITHPLVLVLFVGVLYAIRKARTLDRVVQAS